MTRSRDGRRPRLPTERPARAAATLASGVFVERHLAAAERLGMRLARSIDDPSSFLAALTAGLSTLADPTYREALVVIAPCASGVEGVRTPLLTAVARPVGRALAASSSSVAVYLADALSRSSVHEARLLAHVALCRSLPDDPERTWQVVRRLARLTEDWVGIDTLAEVVAEGILLEPYRWSELEQLVYSPHRMERRLVGSTVATLPFRLPPAARRRVLAPLPALDLIGSLIGDADPDVQKALAWALRSWRQVDPDAVTAFLRAQCDEAASSGDGHRAWVVRDALAGAGGDRQLAAELRARLAGIRRRRDAPSTSRAHAAASAFLGLPDVRELAEAPL